MLRTIPRVLGAVAVIAAAATTAGCGGADKTQACENIQQEIQHLVQTGIEQRSDPPAFAKSLQDSAATIRNEGEPVGGDVEQAAEQAATALEKLSERMTQGSLQQADLNPLVEAGTQIREACA